MEKKIMKLATPGKRLAAYVIDGILPFILIAVIVVSSLILGGVNSSGINSFGFGYEYDYGMDLGFNRGFSIGSVIAIIFAIIIYLVYLGVQIYFYTKSKTIGKAIMGLQVVSSFNGDPIGIGYMILREWFAKKAVGSILCLGYIWILIDDKNRGWHDKIMDTYVVDIKEERQQAE